jgi:flagellar hook-length control protein FliK
MQVNAGGGELKLTLTPEHLGEVTIQVKVTDQHVTATLASDTPEVRQWMTAHQDDLKRGLTGLGLTLDEVVVKDDGKREESRQQAPEDRQRPPRRAPEPAESDKVFEVVV